MKKRMRPIEFSIIHKSDHPFRRTYSPMFPPFNILIKKLNAENQDGSVGRHTAPPRTTSTDRKLNGKEV